jgi:NAD-dependent DNA ligase
MVKRSRELIARFNFPIQQSEAVAQLDGVAGCIIYDGKVEDQEIEFLKLWLVENQEYRDAWPISDLSDIMERIADDGKVETEEREDLYKFLTSVGKDVAYSPVVDGIFARSPKVLFEEKRFVFTGEMLFGSREKAMDAVKRLGGIAAESSFRRDTDFLVVGDLGSEFWRHGRFGRKIEKAMNDIKAGLSKAQIIREKDFVEAVLKRGN